MATKQPKSTKPAKPIVDATVATSAAAQELAKVQAEAFAKTTDVVIDAAAPVSEAADAAMTTVTDTAEAVATAAEQAGTQAEKDVKTMATQFETPKMITEMNDRAKASFAKTQAFAADFGDFNKGNIEAIVESSKIAAKGFEAMGQDAADYTRKSFEGMTSAIKTLATVKSPTEFFKLQGDYMRSAFDSAVAQGSKNTEAMIKLASDAAQPISNRFAVAVEKVKAAA